jgi:hypothetical protein
MKIIILFFFLVISFSGYSKHLDEGKVVNCKVIEHAAQSFDEFDDRVYSNNKSFQFRIKYIDDEGGILELSDKGKELFNEDFFRFKFDRFHNDSYTNQEEADFLGLVKHRRGERVFAKNQPNSYRITFYGTSEARDPTNEWKRITKERIDSFRSKKREQEKKKKKFKIKQRSMK